MEQKTLFKPSGLSHSKYKSLRDEIKVGQVLCLQRDAQNPFDAFAIKLLDTDGNHIGWIPKGQNMEMALMMDQGHTFSVEVTAHDPSASFYDCLEICVTVTSNEDEETDDDLETEGDDE